MEMTWWAYATIDKARITLYRGTDCDKAKQAIADYVKANPQATTGISVPAMNPIK